MKLMVSAVTPSPAATKSPSFSRNSSSTTSNIPPPRRMAAASSTPQNASSLSTVSMSVPARESARAARVAQPGRPVPRYFTFFPANRPTAGRAPTMGAAYLTNAAVTSCPFLAIHASGMLRVFLATFRSSTRSNETL